MPQESLTQNEFVQLLIRNGFEPLRAGEWRTAEAFGDWIRSGRPLLLEGTEQGQLPLPEPVKRLVPPAWLDHGKPTRIIVHWTAGAYLVTALDREHYHFIIDGDNAVHRGDHSVAANDLTTDDDYAAHTRSTNTKAIGVAVACMAGAVEKPFKEGRYPMKKEQWETMAKVVAELCLHYKIEVTPTTVLGHGEVQRLLGRAQAGKWDPMVLPWDATIAAPVVGDRFRALVKAHLEVLKEAVT